MVTMSELLKKKNYLNKNIDYIFSTYIFEYDIRAANINCLKSAGVLEENLYNFLINSPKIEREIYIGKMIRDNKEYQNIIDEIICNSKMELINNFIINTDSIIRIANDAVYFTNPLLELPNAYTLDSNPYITFLQKNIFNHYLKFDNILVFINTLGDEFNVDVKGISESELPLHEPMLQIICKCIAAKESGRNDTAIRVFNNYYQDYITLQLPIEYYREFNSNSGFRIHSSGQEFVTPFISQYMSPKDLDVNYNLKILRILYSYLLR